jgi:hypothetical protein
MGKGTVLTLSVCPLPTYGAEKFPKRIIVLGLIGLKEIVELALARGSRMNGVGEAYVCDDEGTGIRDCLTTSVSSPSSPSAPSLSLSSSEESRSSMALGCACKVSKNDVGEEGAGECIATSDVVAGISSVNGTEGVPSFRRVEDDADGGDVEGATL